MQTSAGPREDVAIQANKICQVLKLDCNVLVTNY